jgi:hypothetical protein
MSIFKSHAAIAVGGCAALAALTPAAAHHSQAAYDQTEQVMIEGTITEVAWRNPHIYLTLAVAGDDGAPHEQRVEIVSVSAARSLGLTQDDVAVGEHVVVRAHPNRRDGHVVFGLDVTKDDGSIHPLSTQGRNTRPPEAVVAADSLAGRWAPVHDPELVPKVRAWPVSELGREGAAVLNAGVDDPTATHGCRAMPPPFVAMLPEGRSIAISEDAVTFTYEPNGVELVRTVDLDRAEHPADLEPSFLGDAIGHWEGDTLVIDTVGFEPNRVGLGFAGPNGTGKHLVERLTLTDDRLYLNYELTVDDPDYLTAQASYSNLWAHRPDLPPAEPCDPETAARYLVE